MQMSSSANLTCRESASAVEYTATVWMPSSRQAQMMRSAISPRLAIRIFLNMEGVGACSCRRGLSNPEQRLPELHGLAVRHQHLEDFAVAVRLDLVHQLHRLDDAQDLPFSHLVADIDERPGARRAGAVESPHDGGLHLMGVGRVDGGGPGGRGLESRRKCYPCRRRKSG